MDTLLNRIGELESNIGDKEALVFKKDAVTFEMLHKRIAGMAHELDQLGVHEGDRVCFMALSKPEMVVTYLGIQLAGGIAVFLDKNGTPESLATIYELAEASLMLSDKPMKDAASRCRIVSLREIYSKSSEVDESIANQMWNNYKMPDEDSIAELLFTSGTTGQPKGVILTYKAVYNILMNTVDGIDIKTSDRLLLPLPLNHSFALRVLRAVLYQGATVVLQNGFTFAKEVENNIVEHKCNCMAAVPSSYEVMKSQMQDAFARVLGGLRFLEFGAGSLSIKQRREITSLLPDVVIYNTWGSSESGGAIFCNVSKVVKEESKVGTLGRTLPHVQVKIVDFEGKTIESAADRPGRMVLKGDMQMSGYWKKPALTDQTLVDGWLFTGDLAYIDADGDIFMLGRADDIINVGGEKVSPIEVEEVAGQYSSIKECACIGVEDTEGILGQIPVLFLVVNNSYMEEDLIKFLSERLERYKLPQKYILIDEIPRNRMQKIDRKTLRLMWNDKDTLQLMNPVMQTILSRRSIRKFTDDSIPENILKMILKAGYYAPSGHNMQSWKFTVLTKAEDIKELKEKACISAKQENVHFYGFENPRVIILVSNDARNNNGCQDASCAAENMMLAATSYGLGSCWLNPLMTLRHVAPVEELLDSYEIPANHVVWAAVALGYPVADGIKLQKNADVIKFI